MRTFTQLTITKAMMVSLFFLSSCATVPLTGRRQLNLVNDAEVMNLSLTQYDQFIKSNKVSTNKTDTERIKRVGNKIAVAVGKIINRLLLNF